MSTLTSYLQMTSVPHEFRVACMIFSMPGYFPLKHALTKAHSVTEVLISNRVTTKSLNWARFDLTIWSNLQTEVFDWKHLSKQNKRNMKILY